MFYFRLTIKGLSKYKNNKHQFKDIAYNKVKAYGLEWHLFVRIYQENENESYFAIYLGATQNPRIQ